MTLNTQSIGVIIKMKEKEDKRKQKKEYPENIKHN